MTMSCDMGGTFLLRHVLPDRREHVVVEQVAGPAGLVAIGVDRRPDDDEAVDAEVDEPLQPLDAVLGRPDDAEAVDELGRQLARLRRSRRACGRACRTRRARRAARPRTRRRSACAPCRPSPRSGRTWLRPPAPSVRAVSTSGWVTTLTNAAKLVARRGTCVVHRPAHPLRVGADGEQHAIRVAAGELEHLRSRGDDLDGNGRQVRRQPVQPAVGGGVGQTEHVDRPGVGALVGSQVVERHRLAAQVGASDAHEALEVGDRRRRQAEVGERGVAATDAEVGAPAARRRGRWRCLRRGGRVAGRRVASPRCRAAGWSSPERRGRGRRTGRRTGSASRRRPCRPSPPPRRAPRRGAWLAWAMPVVHISSAIRPLLAAPLAAWHSHGTLWHS